MPPEVEISEVHADSEGPCLVVLPIEHHIMLRQVAALTLADRGGSHRDKHQSVSEGSEEAAEDW